MRHKIKFSHRYWKMPSDTTNTKLFAVFLDERINLHQSFVEYDIKYYDKETGNFAYYGLPKGKVLVLLLSTNYHHTTNQLWTTIRRWTPEKEEYYRSIVGQEVEILIEECEVNGQANLRIVSKIKNALRKGNVQEMLL